MLGLVGVIGVLGMHVRADVWCGLVRRLCGVDGGRAVGQPLERVGCSVARIRAVGVADCTAALREQREADGDEKDPCRHTEETVRAARGRAAPPKHGAQSLLQHI